MQKLLTSLLSVCVLCLNAQTIEMTTLSDSGAKNCSGEEVSLSSGTGSIEGHLINEDYANYDGRQELDPYLITVMGSSVANGEGADSDDNNTKMGYAYRYNRLLGERYENGQSKNPFHLSNISVNGNNSVDLLNRFNDLEKESGKWVIYGISLGNEGIHGASDQQSVYDQWVNNMKTLIDKARALGKDVIVMNNYTRGDFVESDYQYVKKINEVISRWDVPSVNLLGAIDNGRGNWADGYQNGDDIYHPNTDGHNEFFYAMVPSMMDAMLEGKGLTMTRTTDTSYSLPGKTTIEFTPDGTVHSFTLAVSAKAKDGDIIATLPVSSNETPVTVQRSNGNVVAFLPDNTTLSVASSGAMDNIELSQNYSCKIISLTVNGKSVMETDFTPVSPVEVIIGNSNSENSITLGEIMFYRSSMHTSSPFTQDGMLDKSSLEVYAVAGDDMQNEAMSTVNIKVKNNP